MAVPTLPNAPYPQDFKNYTNIYALSKYQASMFFQKLWDNSIIEGLKKMWADPMDFIIKAISLPFDVADMIGDPLSIQDIQVGNVNFSPCQGYRVNKPVVSVHFGVIGVPQHFHNYMDYAPNTTLQLFLPYYGYVSLDINKYVGKAIGVQYLIDVSNGDFSAFVSAPLFDSVLHPIEQYSGNMAWPINVTGRNSASEIMGVTSSILNLTKSFAATQVQQASAALSALSGDLAGGSTTALSGGLNLAFDAVETGLDIYSQIAAANKPDSILRSTGGGVSGWFGVQKPYLVITRPTPAVPSNFSKMRGYLWYQPAQLGTLQGYTQVGYIKYDSFSGIMPAIPNAYTYDDDNWSTRPTPLLSEIEQLDKLLKSGFWITDEPWQDPADFMLSTQPSDKGQSVIPPSTKYVGYYVSQLKDDPRAVPKHVAGMGTHACSVGEFRTRFSYEHFVIRMTLSTYGQGTFPNYMYIAPLKRYYFVDKVDWVSDLVFDLTCREDYLQTWWWWLKEQTALIVRQENNENEYLIDPLRPKTVQDTYEYLEFPSGQPFQYNNKTTTMITMAGGIA